MSFALDKMTEAGKKRESDTIAKKQLEAIKHALGDQEETYQVVYKGLVGTKVESTGQWLQTDSSFISWADRQVASEPILYILGNERFGKSGEDSEATLPQKPRDSTRSQVKLGLDLLSEDDPTNDWQEYKRLANALNFLGDDGNAPTAWSLLGRSRMILNPTNLVGVMLDWVGNWHMVKKQQIERPQPTMKAP
ncbi:MAG: hypothetical protein M1830_001932 [Pleopsidium flavum]|nr:MAG: hypothetical protein M1830_001932 [Pleopsidium flavum]